MELRRTPGRQSPEYKEWREFALKRANYKCEICGSTKKLHIHHKKSWARFPWLRFSNANSQVLCQECHILKHPHMKDFMLGKTRKKRRKLNKVLKLINSKRKVKF